MKEDVANDAGSIDFQKLEFDIGQELKKSDYIPQAIYDRLPSLLKNSCDVFNDHIERDIYLSGTLAILGGCFHNLFAYNSYDKKKVATNLISIIVGPAASGKGALNYARKVAGKISETYAQKTKPFGKSSGNKLFIPANISSAGMIQLLAKNKGVGVMVESEIDTIVNANKQEWGNYSEMLRKSFENENYSMYRKGKERAESYEIESLKLSLAISGTVNQFKQLIVSPENGLFSRGMYYAFDSSEEKFKFLGRMKSDVDLDIKFAEFAKIANDYYELHLTFPQIMVSISEAQLTRIGDSLQRKKDLFGWDYPEMDASIKRAFIMAQKIAAIISLLSECETGALSAEVKCSDENINTAIQLTLMYLFYGYNAYELLPSRSANLNDSQQKLILLLPEEFSRGEAVKIGVENGISQRGVYYSIEALEKKELIKFQASGKYKKQ